MAQVSSISNQHSPTAKSVTLKISRFNPEHDESSGFMEFNVFYVEMDNCSRSNS